MTLFFLLSAKQFSASLPTVYFVALKLPILIVLAQSARISVVKLAPFCKLSAGLSRTNKFAISLFSFSLTLALSLLCFSFLHFLLFLTCPDVYSSPSFPFFSILSRQQVLSHLFFLGNETKDEFSKRGVLLQSCTGAWSLIPLVFTLL